MALPQNFSYSVSAHLIEEGRMSKIILQEGIICLLFTSVKSDHRLRFFSYPSNTWYERYE